MIKQINIRYIETENNEYVFPKGIKWKDIPYEGEYYKIEFPDNATVTIDFKEDINGEFINRWVISKKEKK